MLQHLELLQTDGSLTSSSTAPLCLPYLTSLGLRAYNFNKLALQTPQLRKLALLCGAHEHSPAVHPQPGKLRMLITLDTLYIRTVSTAAIPAHCFAANDTNQVSLQAARLRTDDSCTAAQCASDPACLACLRLPLLHRSAMQ